MHHITTNSNKVKNLAIDVKSFSITNKNLQAFVEGLVLGDYQFLEYKPKSKRNLLTSSAEFYNLSYDYMNDCLKAGIVFRREFYTDRDIEASDSLMFQISLLPFGGVPVPLIDR